MYMTQCTSVLFRLHDVMRMQGAFYPVFCDFVIVLRFVWLNGAFHQCYAICSVHGGSSVGIEYSCGMSVMWCILSVYSLLKVVKSHYDLSVLAVSLMSLQKKKLDRGMGGLSSIQFFFYFWNFFNFAKPLRTVSCVLGRTVSFVLGIVQTICLNQAEERMCTLSWDHLESVIQIKGVSQH